MEYKLNNCMTEGCKEFAISGRKYCCDHFLEEKRKSEIVAWQKKHQKEEEEKELERKKEREERKKEREEEERRISLRRKEREKVEELKKREEKTRIKDQIKKVLFDKKNEGELPIYQLTLTLRGKEKQKKFLVRDNGELLEAKIYDLVERFGSLVGLKRVRPKFKELSITERYNGNSIRYELAPRTRRFTKLPFDFHER